jgi:hypothetical protein
LEQQTHGVVVGMIGGKVTATPLAEVIGRIKPLDASLLRLAHNLAR